MLPPEGLPPPDGSVNTDLVDATPFGVLAAVL
jgi:hypothetical protein